MIPTPDLVPLIFEADTLDQVTFGFRKEEATERVGGEIRVDRSQLEDDGWRLRVPASVADELRAQGALPPP